MKHTAVLVGFANPCAVVPSFVLPLFSATGNESSYLVQRIQSDKIAGFIAFDVPQDNVHLIDTVRGCSIGDNAVYAFQFGLDSWRVGTRSDLTEYLASPDSVRPLKNHPFIHYDVARFLDDESALKVAYGACFERLYSLSPEIAVEWRNLRIFLHEFRNRLVVYSMQRKYYLEDIDKISAFWGSADSITFSYL